MATNTLAIAAALATKWGAISGIRGATHLVPDGLTFTPFAVVFPPADGVLTEYMEQDFIESTFETLLYLEKPADTGRTLALVYPYLDSAVVAFRTGRTLGGLVQEAFLRGWTLDDLSDYEGRFLGIRFRVGVRTRENITRTA